MSQPRSIVAVSPKPPPLFGKIIPFPLGLIGMMQGNALRRESGLEDPAVKIANALTKTLSRRYGLQVRDPIVAMEPPEPDAPTPDPAPPRSDLVLTVSTVSWEVRLMTSDLQRYEVVYQARLELVDARDQRVLAAGDCVGGNNESDAPTYFELVANNAAALKRLFAEAADYCTDEYRNRLFSIFEP
jgi:hypothetical protein